MRQVQRRADSRLQANAVGFLLLNDVHAMNNKTGHSLETLALHSREPHELMNEAIMRWNPKHIVALTSGGGDSTAALLAVREYIDVAAYIDTGTALPGVREHVESVCARLEVPLIVLETPWEEYESMVLKHGFPGPAQHRIAYIRLKERRMYDLIRIIKADRRERVLFSTGVRQQESVRRMGTTAALQQTKSFRWVAPIIDWDKIQVNNVVRDAGIRQSDVSALMHRSGECNCGAFAAPGERQMLAQLWPKWWQRFEQLEAAARDAGVPAVWGERPKHVLTAEQMRSQLEAEKLWEYQDDDDIATLDELLALSDDELIERKQPNRIGHMCQGCEQIDP